MLLFLLVIDPFSSIHSLAQPQRMPSLFQGTHIARCFTTFYVHSQQEAARQNVIALGELIKPEFCLISL
jgi:hypothetical protein